MVEIYKGELRDMLYPKDKKLEKSRPKIEIKTTVEGHV